MNHIVQKMVDKSVELKVDRNNNQMARINYEKLQDMPLNQKQNQLVMMSMMNLILVSNLLLTSTLVMTNRIPSGNRLSCVVKWAEREVNNNV